MSGQPDFLAGMALSSAARSAAAARQLPLEALERLARSRPPAPRLALSPAGFDLIMELKLSSPANGVLAGESLDLGAQVEGYARAGAAIVSVLTEPARFRGDLAHLRSAAEALRPYGVPAMRKDFLVDAYQLYEARAAGAGGARLIVGLRAHPYQLYEARAAGAGGALLIVRMLTDTVLGELLDVAAGLGLFVLLEAFDSADITRATHAAATWRGPAAELLIGINSRDLVTLQVVPERLVELCPSLPVGHPRVAESGLVDAADAARLAAAGYGLALVGTALMSAPDPVALGRQMIDAGRAVRRAGIAS